MRHLSRLVLPTMCVTVALVVTYLALHLHAAEPPIASPATKADAAGGTVILQTRQWSPDGKTPTGTIWRSFQTWQTDIARTEKGELVRVNSLTPRASRDEKGQIIRFVPGWTDRTVKSALELCPAKEVHGSPWPAENWQAADFNDIAWTRDPNPQGELYGMVALRCLRGKFEVTDPAKAGELSLSVRFRGGAVAYMNGKEIARASLPQGELKPETLAEDYPKDAFVDSEGVVIQNIPANFNSKDPQVAAKFAARTRKLEVKIPASLLKKGQNVLAIEIRRSPACEAMFLAPCYFDGRKSQLACKPLENYWDRCEVEEVKLTAAAGEGIVPNIAPPKGLRAWVQPACVEVDPAFYADPNEKLGSIRLHGLRNGTYSAQIVVSSSEPIKGLNVQVSDLKGPAGTIPAASIQVGYPRPADGYCGNNAKEIGESLGDNYSQCEWPMYGPIEPAAPKEITKVVWGRKRVFAPMQPVWLSVNVGKDMVAGACCGTVTVSADGHQPITTSLVMEVAGDWALPDPANFKTYVGFLESPDAVARRYKVELWSAEHWRLLDGVFDVLGQMGTKEVWIPLVAQTHLGNQYSMVRWIKQDDGTYKCDTTIAEKYLDLAVKHLGKVPTVCLFIAQPQQYTGPKGTPRNQPVCTEYVPATGEMKELLPPEWGTKESLAFWKPVIERMREILAKRSIEKSMTFGYLCDGLGPIPAENPMQTPFYFSDLLKLAPDVKWMKSTHENPLTCHAGKLKNVEFLRNHSHMFPVLNATAWMDDGDSALTKLLYGWRDKVYPPMDLLVASRSRTPLPDNDNCASSGRLRVTAEAVLMPRLNGGVYQGFGSWGADFWGLEWYLAGSPNAGQSFGNVGLSESTAQWFVGAGEKGPVPSCRSRVLQESLQEAEARIFVQNALLDQAGKLGPDLAKRCKELCDERTRMLTYIANFRYNNHSSSMPRARMIPDAAQWEEASVKLYHLADEMARAIAK